MKTKTHFAFRVDIWDDTGDSIVEHVAGVDDFEVAEATYRARWRVGRWSVSNKSTSDVARDRRAWESASRWWQAG
jgi:hypothetical protein